MFNPSHLSRASKLTLDQLREMIKAKKRRGNDTSFGESGSCWLCASHKARIILLTDLSICVSCTFLIYTALIRPLLAAPIDSSAIADKFEEELKHRKEKRFKSLGHHASLPYDRLVAAGGGVDKTAWICSTCGRRNPKKTTRCHSCRAQTSKIQVCTVCHQDIEKVCLTTGTGHELWECRVCNSINTADLELCSACGMFRLRKCIKCGRLSRRFPSKVCKNCGFMPVKGLASPSTVILNYSPSKHFSQESSGNRQRLEHRLTKFGLETLEQKGDGNCLFSSIAAQLFGASGYHLVVRRLIVSHMRSNAHKYQMLFESEKHLNRYLHKMARPGIWGDELSLHAAAEAFGCTLHLVTSDRVNWYRAMKREEDDLRKISGYEINHLRGIMNIDNLIGLNGESLKTITENQLVEGPHVFLSYVYPIHYNAILPVYRPPCFLQTFLRLYHLTKNSPYEYHFSNDEELMN